MRGELPARRARLFPATLLTVFALGACAGGAGGDEGGEGYEFGASQDEIDAAIEDLEPATINYQVSATSENSPQVAYGREFKEAVEESSNGKLTVELVWNQSIATYDEIHDALADGRVDMALTVPSYDPAQFPAFNTMNELLAGGPTTPVIGEVVGNLVAADIGWQNADIIEQYESIGIMPYNPVMALSRLALSAST